MKSFVGGRLLEKIAYCMRKPCKATNIIDEKIEVRDTFPYNPDSKTAPETAQRWADETRWGVEKTYEPEVIIRDNEPFSLTITDLHVRSEGGRAYKVIDSENRRFDLREDQVLEVMKLVGIHPRGIVPGTFVWGIVGSQVRLVLVGGDLHSTMVTQFNEKKAFTLAQAAGLTPTESTLVPGHIYRKKDKSLHAFLGRVKHPDFDKVQFAFVEMPTNNLNEDVDDDDILDSHANDEWIAAHLKERAVLKGWDTMSWKERCHFEWFLKYRLYDFKPNGTSRYSHYEPIKLMASPKFEADVGDIGAEFLAEILANVELKHSYNDMSCNDLSERWKRGSNPRQPRWAGYHDDYRLTFEEQTTRRDLHTRQIEEDITRTRAEFRDALVWR